MRASRTGREALADGVRRLREAGVEDPERDARRLLAAALGAEPGRMALHLAESVSDHTTETYHTFLTQRTARVPVSQIVGAREFYGRSFRVTADTLDPRPDTETLVGVALGLPGWRRVLDLGTGTGCILLTLLAERDGATGIGVDRSAAALAVARANADALGMRADLRPGDWATGLSAADGPFDLIVSNPPYIAADEMAALAPEVRDHEPRMALTDGGDGLGAYRAFLPDLRRIAAPGAWVLVEIGPTQAAAVAAIGREAGLGESTVWPDLDGRDRAVGWHLP